MKVDYRPFGALDEAALTPAPIFPDFDGKSEWSQKMLKAKQENGLDFWPITREVLAHDFETLPKHRFKVWASVWNIPILSRTKIHYYIKQVMKECATAPYGNLYEEALLDKGVGTLPADLKLLSLFDDAPITMNRLQMMAHLILTGMDKKLASLQHIVELGGGIGEMTDVCYHLGFKGQYTTFDFPEVSAIQQYHHEALGLSKDVLGYVHEPSNLPTKADLAIATFSLTEMPFGLRAQILEQLEHVPNWLIMYSRNIFGYDNEKWIQEVFVPRFKNHRIRFIEAPYMPWDGTSSYLVIERE